MARTIQKLTDKDVRAAKTKGRLGDGGGLYLRVTSSNAKSWSFMWNRDGIRKEVGLGPYPAVSLSQAREKAAKSRETLAAGKDPALVLSQQSEPTFAECCEFFLESMQDQWSNAKHRQQWRNTLKQYCKPIANKRVSQIELHDALSVLKKIWKEKPETASRLRGRIERVLNFARVKGWRTGENPAAWRGNLENVLPKPRKLVRGHHPSMPYPELPAFMARLRQRDALAASALELAILTGCRTGEVLDAPWSEFDLEAGIWTIPAQRMKNKLVHRVPLIPATMAILKPLHEARAGDYVFPGQKPGRPLSEMAMEMMMRRMDAKPYTVHGFRATFKDWCTDEASFQWDIVEGSLSHKVGSSVAQAYRRTDALEKRRQVLLAWSDYCYGKKDRKVVSLHAN